MKMRKFSWVAILAGVGFSLTGCADDNDNGGQGADFDASLYYTKSEVDSLIADAVTPDVVVADANVKDLKGVGYVGKTHVGWTPPNGVTQGLFQITGSNDSGEDLQFYIVVGKGEADTGGILASFNLPSDGGYHTFLGYSKVWPDNINYAWHETIHAGAFDDVWPMDHLSISIVPLAWIK